MRELSLCIALLCVCGCATTSVVIETKPPELPAYQQVRKGMSRVQVQALFHEPAIIGAQRDPATDRVTAVTAPALYSTQLIQVEGKARLVDHYILAANSETQSLEDRLWPVVFEDDVVIDHGPQTP